MSKEENLYSVALVLTKEVGNGKINIMLFSKVVKAASNGDAFLLVYEAARTSLKEHQLFEKIIHIITPDMYVTTQTPNQ